MANKLHKSHSNFTLKRLHQMGGYGSIFERDYTTISPMPKLPNGQISIYGSPTFKMSVRDGADYKKKYSYGEWLPNGDEMFWTLDNLPKINKKENKIEIKSDALDLKAFSCYGSALELIDKSISDIISKFPAELYLSDKEAKIIDCPEIKGKIVENPFKINIVKKTSYDSYNVEDIRMFCNSFDKYVIIDENENETPVTSWNSNITNEKCVVNGTLVSTVNINNITIKAYFYEDDLILTHNSKKIIRIRPNKDYQKYFFDNLDDFEKIILNEDTNYTSNFKTIVETDNGYSESIESYKWPTVNRWNLDIEGPLYKEYLGKLSKLGSIYDDLYCDNIIRSMTHEAIINLDNTGLNLSSEDEYDSSKMKKILRVIGRQIDEIKRHADSIKNSRNISYDGNGNMPDYFLKNELSLSGWESKILFKDYDNNIKTPNIYPSRVIGFSPYECNAEFMKRLRINSRYIMSGKGTKMAIESLLALFGFHSINYLSKAGLCNEETLKSAYEITEYDVVVNGYKPNTTAKNVKLYNSYKDSFSENIENEYGYNEYSKLPVAGMFDENGNEFIIPWFDKNQEYDGELYFQSKGEWCEKTSNGIHLVQTKDELYEIVYSLLDEETFYYVLDEDKYYIVIDKKESDNEKGWKSEDSFSEEIKKRLETEKSIISINEGNNPHSGSYDKGASYFKAYTNIFSNSAFNNRVLTNEEMSIINNIGFNISERQIDNKKCHFFGTTDGYVDNSSLRTSNLVPHNLITNSNGDFDEISAVSVLNDKSLNITFHSEYKDFIEEYVIFYLKQIIPSTALFNYNFSDNIVCLGEKKKYKATVNEAVTSKYNKSKINDII